jgi:hypothetical protein
MLGAGDARLPELHHQPYIGCFARCRVAYALSLLSSQLVRPCDPAVPSHARARYAHRKRGLDHGVGHPNRAYAHVCPTKMMRDDPLCVSEKMQDDPLCL